MFQHSLQLCALQEEYRHVSALKAVAPAFGRGKGRGLPSWKGAVQVFGISRTLKLRNTSSSTVFVSFLSKAQADSTSFLLNL